MTRDLTQKQYIEALSRHGFKPSGMGRLWVSHPDFPNTNYGTVYDLAKGRVSRRATVAKVIKDLDRDRKRQKTRCVQ